MTATVRPSAELSEVTRSQAALRAFLHGLPGVDQVGAEARAATLRTRSIKTSAKAWAIDLAIRMVDLTTLEGADTRGKVRALCAKARRPDPTDDSCPHVAAVCVYPSMVATAVAELAGSGVAVASVATAFPSGQAPLAVKLEDTRAAVADGADEIDMVISRGAFLSGRYLEVFDEIAAVKQACGGAHLKVILETGELATYDNVRRASWLAMLAGADFIKTSTGKVTPAATPPVTLVMLEAVRDFREFTSGSSGLSREFTSGSSGLSREFTSGSSGLSREFTSESSGLSREATSRQVGVKPAGGIRTAKDAISYLVLVNETAGEDWLDPAWFRFGASTLLNDLLLQRNKLRTGQYSGPDYVTLD